MQLGTLQRLDLPSRHTVARPIDIWLPPGYFDSNEAYPVLYMHDGQNLFDPETSFAGIPWGMDQVISHLMEQRVTRGLIIVGIWNRHPRRCDYMPEKPYRSSVFKDQHQAFIEWAGGEPVSDAYLKYIVHEIKPYIDSTFRTCPGQPDTWIMGSSMGALVSLYAISEYPDVFHGAGCLSTHWTAGKADLVRLMAQHLPDPATHKLYFDFGTRGLDSAYEPYQHLMDAYLQEAGYRKESNWLTCKFEGADHNEAAWAARVEIPLRFLLARP